MYTCNNCAVQSCVNKDKKAPKNCPTLQVEEQAKIKELYQGEDMKIAHMSAEVEAEGYGMDTRVIEIIKFCKKMGYKRLGLAHCMGLTNEAKIFGKILKAHGLEYEAISCKNGAVSKEFIGIRSESDGKTEINEDPMCNPIGQAVLLEKAGCDIAIIMGLCVGHDTLFIKHCKLPITSLITKDRVLCHNPAAALYQADDYYYDKLYPKDND